MTKENPKQDITIAFQGRWGAYSESACLHLFGEDAQLKPLPNFEAAFQAVENETVNFAVLPVENSTTGSIYENFDLFRHYNLKVVGEIKLLIEHSLLVPPGLEIENITGVRSHPQALAQCSRFFADHPHIEAIPDFDTAGSAEKISKNLGTVGAIASSLAGEEYGLEVLRSNLEDQPGVNQTRFLCLAKKNDKIFDKVANKISLLFIPKENRSGTLYEALEVFADFGIDLLKVESRPLPGSPWQYIFYLDLEGDIHSAEVKEAINTLRKRVTQVQVLGGYPSGTTERLFTSRKHHKEI